MAEVAFIYLPSMPIKIPWLKFTVLWQIRDVNLRKFDSKWSRLKPLKSNKIDSQKIKSCQFFKKYLENAIISSPCLAPKTSALLQAPTILSHITLGKSFDSIGVHTLIESDFSRTGTPRSFFFFTL